MPRILSPQVAQRLGRGVCGGDYFKVSEIPEGPNLPLRVVGSRKQHVRIDEDALHLSDSRRFHVPDFRRIQSEFPYVVAGHGVVAGIGRVIEEKLGDSLVCIRLDRRELLAR